MNRYRRSLIALVLLSFSVAWSAANTMPDEVRIHVEQMIKACKAAGGMPADLQESFLISADLNGDGILDWAIDEGKFQCDGAASIFGGSGGAQVVVYVGMPASKARQAFFHGADGMRLEKKSARAQLWLGVGGQLCGQAGEPSHAEAKYCERPLAWNKQMNKFEFAPLSTIKPLP